MAGQFTIAAEQIYYCGTKTAKKKPYSILEN